ncbi:uncharacterized protein N7500_009096 [Penicillium coprophilum]|uniref:uncharacterized protein n=1 Tax=Penicillium coprophilum TaxID=36646 RepID=UPI00238303C6|nr:uncharacterized protein N7500_009096 [Penicillium coprophilum]KAJ5153657.1 hypothetical protein N7500_009096 [Penicillium coprophilum]
MLGALPVLLLLPVGLAGNTYSQPTKETNTNTTYHNNAGVLKFVNPLIGTYGTTPNGNGGMIPSVSPPSTRENFISQVPYGDSDRLIHGFQATHQPAIWMGEAGQVVLTPGIGEVQPLFQNRGLQFRKKNERSTPYVYEVLVDAAQLLGRNWNATAEAVGDGPVPGGAGSVPDDVKDGANGRTRKRQVESVLSSPDDGDYDQSIQIAMSADSHVGHLRFDFQYSNTYVHGENQPWVFIQASRRNWTGEVHIDEKSREVYGYNTERQDYLLGPDKAPSFKGYFVSRFSEPFVEFGVTNGGEVIKDEAQRHGNFTGAYVKFAHSTSRVEVRTGVSYISVAQARRNLEIQTPDEHSFEDTIEKLKSAWLEKLGRVSIEGVSKTDRNNDPRTIWYTGLFHALQYPSDFSEPTSKEDSSLRTFYSGYTDSVHTERDSYYQSWSIWDTYRAEHSLLTLFAPERVNSMMRSLLRIFDWSGWLPMWANLIETNIMIATNADVVLANALERGFRGFDIGKAWRAVKKDAYTPLITTPILCTMTQGWVSNDGWSEAGSRTLDYAFNDYACSVVAAHSGEDDATVQALEKRSRNYAYLWNNKTQFMQSRNGNGSWADATFGWTEGDDWVYTFDVMHDVKGLAELFGGRQAFREKLDAHFQGGHNDHTNEPSHHGHCLGQLQCHQWWARGNEDLGQMSAWYVFSALGFYPVNPASDAYIVGTPFFEEVSIRLPSEARTGGKVANGRERTLIISAPGAPTKPYIGGLRVDGKRINVPTLKHSQVVNAARIEFEMSATPTSWGCRPLWES